jgi:hypothetical protein
MIVEPTAKCRMRCYLGVAYAETGIGGIVAHAIFARIVSPGVV